MAVTTAKIMLESAYPLQWPLNRPRSSYPVRSLFKYAHRASIGQVRDEVLRELKLYRAKDIVLSTNLKLRSDGLPLSAQRQPNDAGVALYFTDRHGRRICFACDKWVSIEENIYSIAKTIGAIRGIGRWGMQEAVDAAFSGFQALPAPAAKMSVTEAIDFLSRYGERGDDEIADNAQIFKEAYRNAAMKLHPDRGGSASDFNRLEEAYKVVNEAYHGV
jgi:hypothetical protein